VDIHAGPPTVRHSTIRESYACDSESVIAVGKFYRVNSEVSSPKPFPYLAFPRMMDPKKAPKQDSSLWRIDGELCPKTPKSFRARRCGHADHLLEQPFARSKPPRIDNLPALRWRQPERFEGWRLCLLPPKLHDGPGLSVAGSAFCRIDTITCESMEKAT
jgi:hypothetical protein